MNNDGERPRKTYTYYNALEGFEAKPGRRQGNTTRMIDRAIQLLFEHGAIIVVDHWLPKDDYGNRISRAASEDLWRRVQRRLGIEHPGQLWIFDQKFLTIERKGMGDE